MVTNSVTSPLHIFLYKELPILMQQKPDLDLEYKELGWKSEWKQHIHLLLTFFLVQHPSTWKAIKEFDFAPQYDPQMSPSPQLSWSPISTPAAKSALALCREVFS